MDDVTQLHAKERKYARKNLLKKIDSYNKQLRKTRRPSFPLTGPSKDLVYKGVVKVSYDRGYALQTKSLLIKSSTTASEVVEQLFDALGLRGSPTDYALEEHNTRTGEIRVLGSMETPLNLQLNHAPHHSYMELRLVQMKDTRTSLSKSGHYGDGGSDSSETGSSGSPNLTPKEEVIDHGIASVELVMEEALQDIPPLVYDIQQRLKVLSETVAVDGKPRTALPNRRMLWDVLKPQASALVKDIRRLVDNGEFLANRHCSSLVIKQIVTLLLELITDHSRELVTVTKEMCGLRGAAKTEFSGSVSSFIQQITYISKLVGKVYEALHAMALVGHLLEVTAPEKFQQGRLQPESYFTGSGSISGILIFTVVTAYLGLVRAAYEEKKEYYTPLAANMLRSTQRAQEVVQKTDGYTTLHLHPLRSRVRDMEHKLKVAMDNTIRGVKVAAASRPPPVAATEMLLYGHLLIMAVLDFLMVAQCASLLHKVVISGWDLLQFPWIKSMADTDPEGKSDSATASALLEQLSSLGSDSSQSDSRTSLSQKGEKERRSRVPSHQRESGDGMDASELAANERQSSDSPHLSGFGMVGLRASQLKLPYYRSSQSSETGLGLQDSSEELGGRDDDIGRFLHPTVSPSPPVSPPRPSYMEEEGLESEGTTTDLESQTFLQQMSPSSTSVGEAGARHSSGEFDLGHTGIDAVRKLRLRCNINKAIARGAESLLLTVTQKINVLSAACREGAKDKYSASAELIVAAARQITEEVSTMEVDLLVGQSMLESLEKNRGQMEAAVRDVQLATLLASSAVAPESAAMKLMAAVGNLKDICSKTVGVALATVGEHRKSLDQAEKIELEFISLMTGQKQGRQKTPEPTERRHVKRLFSSPAKLALAGELDIAGIVFEDISATHGGGRGWTTKETPKVVGGTVKQLVHRLTYHKVIDSEFADTFLLTFYCFMTPQQLMDALSARYNLNVPGDLSSWEEESFECDVTIPVRLRVIHALRAWLNYSYDDFKDEMLAQKLALFIQTIAISMSSCAKQLQQLLKDNLLSGPAHLRIKPHKQAPTPLVPMGLSREESFDILDVNTLELARQLTLAYSLLLREVRPQELISLGWRDESKLDTVPNIMKFLQLSRNLSQLVCKEVDREPGDDDQASVISYFIHTAKSCLDLKNFEAVFAIMKGLQSKTVQQAQASWQMLSDHVMNTYEELRELVSPEINYHRYRLDIRVVHQSPAVPHLRLILSELEAIDKDHLDTLPEMEAVVNFQKCRHFAKVVRQVQKYQSIPYSIHPIEVMQRYLSSLTKQLSGEELEQLSTKVEALRLQTLFQ